MIKWAVLGVVALWFVFTSFHVIAPGESGVVTRFGRYSHTLGPGVGFTLPSPIDRVQKLDVENIRTIELGSASTETLMLTGDQNIIDIAYSVRWNIRDPELYLFRLKNPDDTIREVAESAMRAVVANYTLNDAIGEGRGDIEGRVTDAMQTHPRRLPRRRRRAGRRDPPGGPAASRERGLQEGHRGSAGSAVPTSTAPTPMPFSSPRRRRARRPRSTRSTSSTSSPPR